tara:strand:+ start:58 stop:414 length:357 start_codon:yes stop_codon:yes gene_type:complete
MMNAKKIISSLAFVCMILATFVFAGGIEQFVDLASLSVVVVLGAIFAASVKSDRSFIQKFGDGCVRAGWIGTLIGCIVIFGSERFTSFNTAEIGPAIAVALLTVLYGYAFKMLAMILD